ncbi:MAG TPA: hypothetical protein VNO79_05460 [Actinomycetota bacterium]|nr:hypothetical protein [Actinomycetota bacterium]
MRVARTSVEIDASAASTSPRRPAVAEAGSAPSAQARTIQIASGTGNTR